MHLDAKQFYYQYDIDATSYKYGRLGDATGQAVQGKWGVQTSGSSTTVTATAGTPFAPVNVGDVIVFPISETNNIRKVASKTSNTEIVLNSAITLAAGSVGWFFYPFRIGTAAGDGWHAVQAYSDITILVEMATVQAAGGIDLSVEASYPNIGGSIANIFQKNYAAGAAYDEPLIITERVQALRVGLKGGSGFAGTDSVTISLVGRVGGGR